ncbi:ISP domain-containing protein [Conidiobolus coronatus NRRL 28638]|uniref:ISP domain-containing protein n=1 Tax=Conidiobolus coronatus (strain ATCC 28846 / CBS 209.66 / NRRL 28638) TaxID=796925 RepID=A0A137PBM6_CONC2|nr:ISP domain-containing protein [Conidiobolus coronatus NRRL 28638]|eukprot:KXN72393.1 ISP domain-containing protein [Conidiobolus coronatus NRRL 28638]
MPVLVAYCNDGKFYAIDNRCSHMGYPLHVGRVVDIEDFGVCFGKAVKCEAHFWTFSLDNGQCDRTAHQLKTYKVEVENEDVYLLNP